MPEVTPDQFHNQLAAEAHLALLDALEPDAMQHDAEICPALRHAYAASYRKLVGVAPEQRSLLRVSLERLQETGARSVGAIIAQVRAQSENSRATSEGVGA